LNEEQIIYAVENDFGILEMFKEEEFDKFLEKEVSQFNFSPRNYVPSTVISFNMDDPYPRKASYIFCFDKKWLRVADHTLNLELELTCI